MRKKKQRQQLNFSKRFIRVFSRHPSHQKIRKENGGVLCPELAVIRLGSTTPSKKKIQINSIESIKNSSNKLLMKQCFDKHNVATAVWFPAEQIQDVTEETVNGIKFPVVAKHIYGSRNTGNTLIKCHNQLECWMNGRYLCNYIIEKYHNYTREYRLHVTKFGCFYTCRKMLRNDATGNWFRNDSNCVWVLKDNPLFDIPDNWNEIEATCVKAIASVGLDIGSCDVRVNKEGMYIVLETNSASSFGEITAQKYAEILPKLVADKAESFN